MKQFVINLYPLLQGKSRKVALAAMPSVLLIFSLLFMAVSCEPIPPEQDCAWIELTPSTLTEQLNTVLDVVFSENNELVRNIEGDNLLYVINSKEELLEISHNINTVIDIDFENQSIIWGKFLTASISDSIASKQLFVCYPSSNYKYEVSVKKCTECWHAVGYLYYWNIYPQKINSNNISLIINQLED